MKGVLWFLVALVIFYLLTSSRDTKEGFFATDPAVCRRVRQGEFPQIALQGVLTPRECQEIIADAEDHAQQHGGWKTNRHGHYPTTDLDTADIPKLRYPVQNIVYRRIIPKMAREFDIDSRKLGIGEVFIAKYSADIPNHQRSLGRHKDGSDFSFVVALNDGFHGGGTKFEAAPYDISRPSVGSAVGFCGKSKHEGVPVIRGTRYILAGFLKFETPEGC